MRRILLMVVLGSLLLTGCSSQQPALKVQNLLNKEKTTPDSSFDVKSITPTELHSMTIVNKNGNPITFNKTQPILFEAYWCPHCQRTLLLLSSGQSKLKNPPVIVSTGFPKNTSLKEAVATSKKEFKMLGITGFKVYYALKENKKLITGFPTLVFTMHSRRVKLVGEHTFSVWKKALS
ncbi:hypothetical protein [Alicyclobacillus sp. SO9]|uniref:hypothetical protein n=1 Tax=Alicyclobacillus sp. SO9 TaxID=2665646 RepID=UPI0018E7087E|nr:hypothetical protein [Alicyclobacillus sp. SO9]QQE79551.1 hypothetical protein GI364_03380 [Alicyclobacillus sp. SO9]